MFKFLDKIDAKLTQVLLTILLFVSVVSEYFSDILEFPNNWEIPVILAALLLIVNMLKKIYDVDDNTKKLLGKSDVEVLKKYDSYNDFYHDLTIAVKNARKSLDLTHIRNESPTAFSKAKYYEEVTKLFKNNNVEYIRRITTMSNKEMIEYVKELKLIEKEVPNYHIRICNWNSNFPMVNMAIVDEEMVFILLTAEITEKSSGLLIRDSKACQYFTQYFTNIWSSSINIPDEL